MTFEIASPKNPALREILTDERAYLRMANDSAPTVLPELPGSIRYVLAKDREGPCAVFLLAPRGIGEDEIHFCFAPRRWGWTKEIAAAFMAWLWKNTSLQRVIGPVPGYNRLALKLAQTVGFREFERKPNAVTKHRRAYDLILTSAERPA